MHDTVVSMLRRARIKRGSLKKFEEAFIMKKQVLVVALGGTAAINVTVEQNTSLIDILLNSVTGSIIAGEEVRVTGTVIK